MKRTIFILLLLLSIINSINAQYFFTDSLTKDTNYYPVIEEIIVNDLKTNEIIDHHFIVIGNVYPKGFLPGFSYSMYNGIKNITFHFKDFDTCFIKGKAIVFYNPFPHVFNDFYRPVDTIITGIKPEVGGGRFYTEYTDNYSLMEKCMLNDSLGTLKYYWHFNGKKKKEGHFWYNQKNGKWQYWNEKGIIYKEEWYDKGKLLKKTLAPDSQ